MLDDGTGRRPGAEDVPCSPCVAQLHSPAEELAALRAAIEHEPDPLVTLTHLLHLCRDEHPVLWEQAGNPATQATVTQMLEPLRALARSRPATAALDPATRRGLVGALQPVGAVAPVVVARELAQFLDDHYGQFFADSFRRRSPYQPGVGDPIPLGGPDVRTVMDMQPTAPPWRLANRLDETRHVRLAGGWATQFRVVFDYSLVETATELITTETIVATCHPNRGLTEFTLPDDPSQPAFPVQPAHLDAQRAHLDRLVRDAVRAGASIVVLPELCVTEALAHDLQNWVKRDDGPQILVAGSYHHADGSPPRRRNTALAWIRGHDRPLIHDKHSPAEQPIREDIQPQGWPEVRVYVTAEGWHLVLAICRDLLNPQAVHTLAEIGANVVLVPAMSESLAPFTGQVAHLVGSAQAFVAVANNPADWAGNGAPPPHRAARALFGHPGLGQQTRQVTSPDTAPGIATLHVRSGQLRWIGTDYEASPGHRNSTVDGMPQWATRLAATLRPYLPNEMPSGGSVTLRTAAVLVLLTEGPTGPQVLLTQRTSDLHDYPGRLVFPGGVQDPGDGGPVATALREAREEIGLNQDGVRILGVLPAVTEPETRFLVVPVLGWSKRIGYLGAVNLAEVDGIHQVPLHRIATRRQVDQRDRDHLDNGADYDLSRLGSMTAWVIDTLIAMLTPSASGADPLPFHTH
ncbi:NUDIX domain-containing protein [Nocardia cyriacigeorgica]|nr:NUDIX domain-containing protein [Nocardia cyriacigeorgica]MBF6320817.1 NUDIX domain-containing protein [Nocardia cyriacigeorgica]MBF6518364.1 NUDIX domain-containing protein [Nocardia cyriacigeorgica]